MMRKLVFVVFGGCALCVSSVALSGCEPDSLQRWESRHPGPNLSASVIGTVTDVSCTRDEKGHELFRIAVQEPNEHQAHEVDVIGPIPNVDVADSIVWTLKRKNEKQLYWDVYPDQPSTGTNQEEPCQ